MQRNLEQLSNKTFDVLVIGGGIHGAVTAWDAALRGLSVALIERGDFGSATSQNSLKTIHGGLRYLQDGNLSRIRKMAYERTTWMKIAPHLVHPFPCLTITQKKFTRSRLAMRVALTLNDLLSFDRNRLSDPEKHLPGGKVISQSECARLLPGYEDGEATGAAVWHDAQIYNSERLLLEFVLSAVQAGAQVANYIEATSFLREGDRIVGVQVKDNLSGQAFEIRSGVVINCAGAWINGLLEKVVPHPDLATSVALNLIVDKVWSGIAAGIPSHPGKGKRSQVLFIVPWRNKSMIGTWHIHWNDAPDKFHVREEDVQEFIGEINTAHPRMNLSLKDIKHVQWGFLPVSKENAQKERVKLERDDQVIDHQTKDALSGLISVVSVKYTTARVTAEKTIDLAVGKLARKTARPCQTAATPVDGGKIEDFRNFLKTAHPNAPTSLDNEILEHLAYTYGSNYEDLIKVIQENPELGERLDPDSPVTMAEVLHAVRHEMAITLKDVIQRRTELGAAGLPSMTAIDKCVELLARDLGWSIEQQQQEIASVLQAYPFHPDEKVRA